MRKRYPHTVWALTIIVSLGALLALVALWEPFAYIFLGCMIIALLATAIRDDRKRER